MKRPFIRAAVALAIAVAGCQFFLPFAFAGYDPAGLRLPPGFKVSTYATGDGFHENQRGIPAIVSMTFDQRGALYLARTANRLKEIYGRGDARIYRVLPGVSKITPATEDKFLFGPPLEDPDEVAVNRRGEIFVSASHPAGYGVIYRVSPDGAGSRFAGGPASSRRPLLSNPEGIAFDKAGNLYAIDNDLGVVVKLDSSGRVIDPRWLTGLGRGRTLTMDGKENLWIGSDGAHGTEHIDRNGAILRVPLTGDKPETVYSGALPSGMSFSPGGHLFVAQRRGHKIFALTPAGKRVEFASLTGRSALRTLAFPPVTAQTQKLGIAGDLFVMVFPMLDYPVREIIRITGPFDNYIKQSAADAVQR